MCVSTVKPSCCTFAKASAMNATDASSMFTFEAPAGAGAFALEECAENTVGGIHAGDVVGNRGSRDVGCRGDRERDCSCR